MAVYIVGDFLKELRLRKGYTQEDVSFGICTPASLSRIENGIQTPGRLILDKLLERLGTENYIFNVFVSREELELYETLQEIARNIADGNIVELEKKITIVENLTKDTQNLEQQYLLFAKAELLRRKGINEEERIEMLIKSIHITLPQFDGKTPLKSNLLTFDEIVIINSIAIWHAGAGHVEEAIKLGSWLKEYVEEKVADGKLKTAKYPMIVYDLSKWLGKIGYFAEAFDVIEQGIDFCIKYGNLLFLPLLIFNKAYCMVELNKAEEAKKYFKQSIAIFEAMKLEHRTKMATDWCKSYYGDDF